MKRSALLFLLCIALCASLAFAGRASAFSCHSICEDKMMEWFEDCERRDPGAHCTNDAHTFFCGCMAGCSGDPTPECPANLQ